MGTRTTLTLLRLIGIAVPLFVVIGSKTHRTAFFACAAVSAFLGLGLMAYVWFRENSLADKSPSISNRAVVTIFCVVGLWIVF